MNCPSIFFMHYFFFHLSSHIIFCYIIYFWPFTPPLFFYYHFHFFFNLPFIFSLWIRRSVSLSNTNTIFLWFPIFSSFFLPPSYHKPTLNKRHFCFFFFFIFFALHNNVRKVLFFFFFLRHITSVALPFMFSMHRKSLTNLLPFYFFPPHRSRLLFLLVARWTKKGSMHSSLFAATF